MSAYLRHPIRRLKLWGYRSTVQELRERLEAAETARDIAADWGVTRNEIYQQVAHLHNRGLLDKKD